jgi:hypothetical protein
MTDTPLAQRLREIEARLRRRITDECLAVATRGKFDGERFVQAAIEEVRPELERLLAEIAAVRSNFTLADLCATVNDQAWAAADDEVSLLRGRMDAAARILMTPVQVGTGIDSGIDTGVDSAPGGDTQVCGSDG